jgi:hypothetical protein
MSDDLIARPCLCCNAAVSVSRREWLGCEAPAALCMGCFNLVSSGRLPWPQVRMLDLLRCQVAGLRNDFDLMSKRMLELQRSQQELEQGSLGR